MCYNLQNYLEKLYNKLNNVLLFFTLLYKMIIEITYLFLKLKPEKKTTNLDV